MMLHMQHEGSDKKVLIGALYKPMYNLKKKIVEVYQMMHLTRYQVTRPYGFRQEHF